MKDPPEEKCVLWRKDCRLSPDLIRIVLVATVLVHFSSGFGIGSGPRKTLSIKREKERPVLTITIIITCESITNHDL